MILSAPRRLSRAELGADLKVSVVLNTARGDAAFHGRSILGTIVEDLRRQSLHSTEFEFIAVDGLYTRRPGELEETGPSGSIPFATLHMPPRETAMVLAGRPAICAYKNSGIMFARGEVIVSIDDGCHLDPGYLERCWRAWDEDGVCLNALADGLDASDAWRPEKGHRDSRRIYLDARGQATGPVAGNPLVPPGQGFIAFPLQAAFDLNGYDEAFDGTRGLEDTDFGARLQRAGYKIKITEAHRVGLYELGGWDEAAVVKATDGLQGVVKCCQTTFRVRNTETVAANRAPWTDLEWSYVTPRCRHLSGTCCSLFGNGHPCPYVGILSDREHPGLVEHRANPSIFDLREERARALQWRRMAAHGYSSTPPRLPESGSEGSS